MNILFILGNGFDLNLDMNTSYKDFYNYYQSIDSKSDFINKLKKNISENFKNWSDLELAIGEYTENINSVREFDDIFIDIRKELANYLRQEEKKIDTKAINIDKIFKHLAFPESTLSNRDIDELKSFKDTWARNQWNVRIITLNYTKTIEKLLGGNRQNLKIGSQRNQSIMLQGIEHIHGYVDDKMVLGVNDISQIKNKSFHEELDILEGLVKDTCNQAHKHQVEVRCKQQVSSANLICIFGSSIGDTDKQWWERIGEQLKQNCRLIIFDIYDSFESSADYTIPRIERGKIKMFLDKTKLSDEEKRKVNARIHIGLNTDIFKEIISTDKKTKELV